MIKKITTGILFLLFSIAAFSQPDTIAGATYNFITGELVIKGNLDPHAYIDASKLSIHAGSRTWALQTTPNVNPTSPTEATLTLDSEDKLYINAILNNNGNISAGGSPFFLDAEAGWNGSSAAEDTVNPVTVSNYNKPEITNSTYDENTGELIVDGHYFAKIAGIHNNDVVASRFIITGKNGETRRLLSSPDREVDSENQFTLFVTGSDKTEVDRIIDKDGTRASDGTTYNLAAEDDWNNIPDVDESDPVNEITASNANSPPTAIDLTPQSVDENEPAGTVVGVFTTTDPDEDNTHVYTLVSGETEYFDISDDELVTTEIFDFETISEYGIIVRSTDQSGGSMEESFTITVNDINEPPIINNIIIPVNDTIDAEITPTYDFDDPDGDTEGEHEYQWYRSATGTLPGTAISGAIAASYTTTDEDGGQYIRVEIIPYDEHELAGEPETSNWCYINAKPVAENPEIDGIVAEGQTVSAIFDYSDTESDPEGEHSYAWYRNNNPYGTGTLLPDTLPSYQIIPADKNNYIRFTITPVATSGSTPGAEVTSDWYGPVSELPTATMSGSDTVCAGSAAEITVDLTGTSPWSLTYTVTYTDGITETTDTVINDSPFTFEVTEPGDYEPTEVSDSIYLSGTVSGKAIIRHHEEPRMTFSGGGEICKDSYSSAPLTFTFQAGEAPWTVNYFRNTPVNDTTIYPTESPWTIEESRDGTYEILSFYDDNGCEGDTSELDPVVISYDPESPVATISGTDTICPGDEASLTVEFEGPGPWDITYTIDDLNPTLVENISDNPYTLHVDQPGTVKLTHVENESCTGMTNGTAVVESYSTSSAVLSGGETICEYTTTDLTVEFTGEAPWTFSYARDNKDTVTVSDIQSSPYVFPVSEEGTYTLVSLEDPNCPGAVSGSAYVDTLSAPDVEISGLSHTYSIASPAVPVQFIPEPGYYYPSPPHWDFPSPPFIYDFNESVMKFYPNLQSTGIHEYVYSYQGNNECLGYDTATVHIIEHNATIYYAEDSTKTNFCFNDEPFLIHGFILGIEQGIFSIEGGLGLTDHGDNTATIDPSVLDDNTYTVRFEDVTNPAIYVEKDFSIEVVDPISFAVQEEFCNNDNSIRLNGNSEQGIFHGDAVTGNYASGYYFNPPMADPGMDTIFYSLTSAGGCKREIFEVVEIKDAPSPDFAVDDVCIHLGNNDSVQFVNQTPNNDSITAWSWDFDDIGSGAANYSSKKDPKHLYTNASRRVVELAASHVNGCSASIEKIIDFGDKPVANFTWNNECFYDGIEVNFTNTSTSNTPIESYLWRKYSGNNYNSVRTENAVFDFNELDQYDIELIINTQYGCADTIKKSITLRPVITISDDPYYENFESGRKGWISESINLHQANTWTLDEPAGEIFNGAASGTKAWYTDLSSGTEKEQSAITSPCFNFEDARRPMIKLNLWRVFDQMRDGAVLQYSVDHGATWVNVGSLADGINWYNEFQITGLPGGQSIGWSNIRDNNWKESRHKLDVLRGKNNVRLRIAYGSDGTGIINEGIAFDDIWIGEREKMVLLEHFTSTENNNSKQADSIVNHTVNSNPRDAVDVHYHTSLSGSDPFYAHNPVDPNARLLYYGLSSIPYALLDGGTGNDTRFDFEYNIPDSLDINLASLQDAKFRLDIGTEISGNAISVSATITALQTLNNREISLHLAVVERNIQPEENGATYESVLKALLPSAAGSNYFRNWSPGDKETVNYNWPFSNVYDPDEIRVVGFIQDDATKEVYQAAIDKNDLISAINLTVPFDTELNYIIYPNPFKHNFNILLHNVLNKPVIIELYNTTGQSVYQKKQPVTGNFINIHPENLRNGIYYLRILHKNKVICSEKVILSE